MFDRLFEILAGLWRHLIPFQVIPQYEKGVHLRFGKFFRVVEAGLVWKVPFADEILTHHVVVTTINLPPQSLATKDEKNIVVSAVVKFRVTDIKTFLLEIYDSVDAIGDLSQGIIRKVIINKSWDECKSEEIDNEISKRVRAEAKKWGIEVSSVTLANLAQIKSIRLFNDSISTHVG